MSHVDILWLVDFIIGEERGQTANILPFQILHLTTIITLRTLCFGFTQITAGAYHLDLFPVKSEGRQVLEMKKKEEREKNNPTRNRITALIEILPLGSSAQYSIWLIIRGLGFPQGPFKPVLLRKQKAVLVSAALLEWKTLLALFNKRRRRLSTLEVTQPVSFLATKDKKDELYKYENFNNNNNKKKRFVFEAYV